MLVLNGGGPPPGPALAHHGGAGRGGRRAAAAAPRAPGRALPAAPSCERARADRRDRVDEREGADRRTSPSRTPCVPAWSGWLRTLSRELGPDGITVNTIAPGTDRHRPLPRRVAGRAVGRGSRADLAPTGRDGGGDRRAWRASSPPRRRPTSPERRSRSTAASPEACSSGGSTMRRLLTPGRLLLASAGLAVVVLFLAWVAPAGDYLYVPNAAQAARRQGARSRAASRRRSRVRSPTSTSPSGGRRGWSAWFRSCGPDGLDARREDLVVPPGTSFDDRRDEGKAQMDRSERVAAAVALREAGYDVPRHRAGRSVEGVDPTVPAADVLEYGDVIVAAAGRRVRTPGTTPRGGRHGRARRPRSVCASAGTAAPKTVEVTNDRGSAADPAGH